MSGGFRIANESESLGLGCTRDGVALAGAPLLKMTVAGLAPRPIGEIDQLLKAAYGPSFAAACVLTGLNLIAEALNRGDLARAMVAAVQLKLPDVSWAAAARMARIENALAKFNPLEPRDWRGWWTTGGAAKPDHSRKPSPVRTRSAAGPGPRRTSNPVRSGRVATASAALTPMMVARRLAIGEEVVGGGPEDPLADAAALATLAAGALLERCWSAVGDKAPTWRWAKSAPGLESNRRDSLGAR